MFFAAAKQSKIRALLLFVSVYQTQMQIQVSTKAIVFVSIFASVYQTQNLFVSMFASAIQTQNGPTPYLYKTKTIDRYNIYLSCNR